MALGDDLFGPGGMSGSRLGPYQEEPVFRESTNVRAIPRQIQEFMGAIQPTQPGKIESILSGRFQPNDNDIASGAFKTLFSDGNFTSGEDVAGARINTYADTMAKLAKLTGADGGGGGATGELVQMLRAENPGMSFGDALFKVQTGFRNGVEYDEDGSIKAISGYGQAKGVNKYGENLGGETATQQVRSEYEPGRAEDIATRQAGVSLEYNPIEDARSEAMKEQAKIAQANLSAFDKADVGYDLVKKATAGLRNADGTALDPGVSSVVGLRNPLKGALPFGYNIGGTSAGGGQAKIDQLKGKAFLDAFESLKGGGSITEKEGEAATAAKIRLGQAQKEQDYLVALTDFEYEVDKLYELAQTKRARARSYLDSLQQNPGQTNMGNPYARRNPALDTPYDQITPEMSDGGDEVQSLIDRYAQ